MHVKTPGREGRSSPSLNCKATVAQNEILTGDKQETSRELLQEDHTLNTGQRQK